MVVFFSGGIIMVHSLKSHGPWQRKPRCSRVKRDFFHGFSHSLPLRNLEEEDLFTHPSGYSIP